MEFRKVEIGQRFSNEPPEEIQRRLSLTREVLRSHGGTFTEEEKTLKSGVRQIIFKAELPEEQVKMHHGFEHKINSADNCGAAWLLDSH